MVQGIIQGFLSMWETDTCQPQGFLPAAGGGFAVVVVEGLGVVGGSRTLYRAWAIIPEIYGHKSGLALRGGIRDRLMRVRTSFLRLVTSNAKCTSFKGTVSEDFYLNRLAPGF